jgi:pimeloyl-ACP methyl ester carboxylesterase
VPKELPVFRSEEVRTQLMAIYDEAMRRWPVSFETFFAPTRYGATHVIASGDPASPPLFMLHPAAVGGFVWSSIIAPLSDKHRIYALDTIGDVGKSELTDPERYPKSGREYAAWLDDVYERPNITRADVVAGSMGGWIAMNHAIYAPYRLRRLVLLGPMGLPAWHTTLAVLVPFGWYRVRPTEAKFDRIIFRSLGEGARANREFRPWMKIMAQTRPLVGQPIHISARKLGMINPEP